MKEYKILRVKGSSSVKNLAGCIVSCFEKGENVELRGMGASAINQLFKSSAVARSILSAKGTDIAVIPGFGEIEENGEKRTIMIGRIMQM
jgi:stage V sporulation protein SpoVS